MSLCVLVGLRYIVILDIQPELIFLQDPDRSGCGYSDLIQICELRNARREILLCVLLEKIHKPGGKRFKL